MIKLFRKHRGSLVESLKTIVEVNNLEDIKKHIDASYLKNMQIKNKSIEDDRLPNIWGNIEYMVVADFDDYKEQCVGFCNFYNE